jgi:hypothetical protein
MDEMNITSAQYVKKFDDIVCINASIDGEQLSVPICEGNRHYKEILRQVEEGTLTIADAEPVGEE